MPPQANVPSGTNIDPSQLLCTPKQAMVALQISKSSLYELLHDTRIRSVKVGTKSRRIIVESLHEYINECESTGL